MRGNYGRSGWGRWPLNAILLYDAIACGQVNYFYLSRVRRSIVIEIEDNVCVHAHFLENYQSLMLIIIASHAIKGFSIVNAV